MSYDCHQLGRPLLQRGPVDDAEAGHRAEAVDDEVLGHAHVEGAPAVVAILRDHGDAGPGHRAGPPGAHGPAGDLDPPAVEGDQARQQVAELALPVALDAGHPHDLAGAHVEIEPVEYGDAVPVHGRVGDAQHDGVGRVHVFGGRVRGGLLDDVRGADGRGLVAQRHRPADH